MRGARGLQAWPPRRRGAALVEFAVVAPLLFLLILGLVEFARMMMVQQILTNGAREGARNAVLPAATQTTAQGVIDTYMQNNGITGYSASMTDPGAAQPGDPITVTVSVPYSNVSWLPIPTVQWLGGKTLTASVVMRKET
jgi:Flp pilus assembly protein TadG